MSDAAPRRGRTGPLAALLVGLFAAWRLVVSPLVGPSCRFQPSCSAYGIEAVRRHGAIIGLWLTLRRLGRCHPWGGHGPDPVPETAGVPLLTRRRRA